MRITLLALKAERTLELWAANGNWKLVRTYPILAASGMPGPKLQEGDRQVPEGIYRIVRLNPNSRYHLSLKLDYPNDFDRHHAAREGRDQPGSDIFIHGKAVSTGCLAIGDPAIEELFVLVAGMGMGWVEVVIAPHDPRQRSLFPIAPELPPWTADLYRQIRKAFENFGR